MYSSMRKWAKNNIICIWMRPYPGVCVSIFSAMITINGHLVSIATLISSSGRSFARYRRRREFSHRGLVVVVGGQSHDGSSLPVRGHMIAYRQSRRMANAWRLNAEKMRSTRAPMLSWCLVQIFRSQMTRFQTDYTKIPIVILRYR